MARVDVTVRGAGIFGLSVAWACARRGARVRVIDPGGVGAGASGGLVGAMAPHVPEQWNDKKAFQLDSLLMAQGWWAAVEAASGLASGYGRSGRLQPLADAAAVDLARARALSAAALWQGRAVWQVVPVAGDGAGGEWVPASASGWMVRDDLTARVQPRMALAALAAAVRATGGTVVADGRDEGPDEGLLVLATGVAGLAELTAAMRRAMGVAVKGQAVALRCDAAHLPQLFVGGLHIVPHVDGSVVVGSTSESVWQHEGVDAQADDLVARARALVPALAGAEVVERWAGFRPRAKSRAPLLGGWPGRPGVFVANGGFKIGFGMAPKVGEVMADLVLEGRDGVPEGFRL